MYPHRRQSSSFIKHHVDFVAFFRSLFRFMCNTPNPKRIAFGFVVELVFFYFIFVAMRFLRLSHTLKTHAIDCHYTFICEVHTGHETKSSMGSPLHVNETNELLRRCRKLKRNEHNNEKWHVD